MGRWERAATEPQLKELGPLGQLRGDGVSRPPLHNDPAGHGVPGFVTAPAQQLLDTAPVSFELGYHDSARASPPWPLVLCSIWSRAWREFLVFTPGD